MANDIDSLLTSLFLMQAETLASAHLTIHDVKGFIHNVNVLIQVEHISIQKRE